MALNLTAVCDRCTYKQSVLLETGSCRQYEGEGLEGCPVLWRHAWCMKCDCITPAEVILDRETLEVTMLALTRGGTAIPLDVKESFGSPLTGHENVDEIADADRRSAVSALRQLMLVYERRSQPPRCLECGSPLIVPLRHGTDVVHPKCGGRLKWNDDLVFAATNGPGNEVFSIEGEAIRRDGRWNL